MAKQGQDCADKMQEEEQHNQQQFTAKDAASIRRAIEDARSSRLNDQFPILSVQTPVGIGRLGNSTLTIEELEPGGRRIGYVKSLRNKYPNDPTPQDWADVRFLVRAVNSHAALLAALAAISALSYPDPSGQKGELMASGSGWEAVRIARAAITAAEEE